MKLQWKKERFYSEKLFWIKLDRLVNLPFWAVLDLGPRWTCATFSMSKATEVLPTLSENMTPYPIPVPIGCVGWVSYEAASIFDTSFKVKKAKSPPIQLFPTQGAHVYDRYKQTLHTIGDAEFFDILHDLNRNTQPSKFMGDNRSSKSLKHTKHNEFICGVNQLKAAIQDGDLYQCNLSWRSPTFNLDDGFSLWKRLRFINSAHYGAYIKTQDREIICNSPERFLNVSNNEGHKIIETGPIKGTSHLSEGLQGRLNLWKSSKERAELTMVVDMSRNDLGRISKAGTIMPSARKIRRCGDLYHAEQIVKGELQTNSTEAIFAATFPPASVTGAPKHAAVDWINRLEPHHRDIYTGSIGYIDTWGNTHWNVAIRTIQAVNSKAHFHVGCGIVHDSQAELEWKESISKSTAIMRCLGKSWI